MVAHVARREWVDALEGRASGPLRSVWSLVLSLIFAIALTVLLPLADASPPDQMWIPGIYDEADLDEAIVAVVSASGVVATTVRATEPANGTIATVALHVPALATAAPPSPFSIRAPPSLALEVTT